MITAVDLVHVENSFDLCLNLDRVVTGFCCRYYQCVHNDLWQFFLRRVILRDLKMREI